MTFVRDPAVIRAFLAHLTLALGPNLASRALSCAPPSTGGIPRPPCVRRAHRAAWRRNSYARAENAAIVRVDVLTLAASDRCFAIACTATATPMPSHGGCGQASRSRSGPKL